MCYIFVQGPRASVSPAAVSVQACISSFLVLLCGMSSTATISWSAGNSTKSQVRGMQRQHTLRCLEVALACTLQAEEEKVGMLSPPITAEDLEFVHALLCCTGAAAVTNACAQAFLR